MQGLGDLYSEDYQRKVQGVAALDKNIAHLPKHQP